MRHFTSVTQLGDLKNALEAARYVKEHPFADQELGRNKTLLMIFFNTTGLGGTLLLGALLVTQILIMALTRNNSLIHDLLAGTVVVDVASQMIFRDTQDLIDYKKRLSREQSDRQTY